MSIEESQLKSDLTKSMESAITAFKKELSKVRTGRATVSMLDVVQVSYYGAMTPLQQVATVSCPDSRSFLITPWESSTLKDIEAAIVKSNLGMSPQNDGKAIRLKVPELTEERRLELIKQVKKMAEDSRVSIRMSRQDANHHLKKSLKSKEISEDQQKSFLEIVQKITDDYVKKVDEICGEKEVDLKKI